VVVKLKPWMETHYGCVRFGVGREAIKIEPTGRVFDPLKQRFELLALQRNRPVLVLILNENPMFLYVRNPERRARKRGKQRRITRQFLSIIQQIVPRCAERHS
jgi:hypothetical protein